MPPAPSWERISYGPSFVPAGSVTSGPRVDRDCPVLSHPQVRGSPRGAGVTQLPGSWSGGILLSRLLSGKKNPKTNQGTGKRPEKVAAAGSSGGRELVIRPKLPAGADGGPGAEGPAVSRGRRR